MVIPTDMQDSSGKTFLLPSWAVIEIDTVYIGDIQI